MVEWGITPDYITNNWSEELLDLMIQKMIERKEKEYQAIKGSRQVPTNGERVSDSELLARMGIKVQKKNAD